MLRAVAPLPPQVVVSVLAAAGGIGTQRLQVTPRVNADPDIFPGWWDDQGMNPGENVRIAHRDAVRAEVPESAAAPPAPNASTARVAPGQLHDFPLPAPQPGIRPAKAAQNGLSGLADVARGSGATGWPRRPARTTEGIMTGQGTATTVWRSIQDAWHSSQDPMGIYLNDHLAGSTAGAELARRVANSEQVPAAREAMQRFATDVAEDRRALLDIMADLKVPVRGYKVYAGWIGEKAGRLKFNGRLRDRSPLSSLEELELLRLGVQGKAAGWRTLRALADRDRRLDSGRLDELMHRARRQADFLERSRVRAAERVIDATRATSG